jgi:AbrB family looped-hinge helix DNA binding protein
MLPVIFLFILGMGDELRQAGRKKQCAKFAPSLFLLYTKFQGFLALEESSMNLAKVSNNGQITVPTEIRRALKLKEGDKILFFQKENGEIVVNNTSLIAIQEAQDTIAGSNYSEDEILTDIMKLRYGE